MASREAAEAEAERAFLAIGLDEGTTKCVALGDRDRAPRAPPTALFCLCFLGLAAPPRRAGGAAGRRRQAVCAPGQRPRGAAGSAGAPPARAAPRAGSARFCPPRLPAVARRRSRPAPIPRRPLIAPRPRPCCAPTPHPLQDRGQERQVPGGAAGGDRRGGRRRRQLHQGQGQPAVQHRRQGARCLLRAAAACCRRRRRASAASPPRAADVRSPRCARC